MSDDGDSTLPDSDDLDSDLMNAQLQIVEVLPYDRTGSESQLVFEDGSSVMQFTDDDGSTKYAQVVDSNGKSLMHLDLLNLSLLKSDEGNSYELVHTSDSGGEQDDYGLNDTATVTCVLQSSSDGEEQDGQEYVLIGNDDDDKEAFVMMNTDAGPVMYWHADLPPSTKTIDDKPKKEKKPEKKEKPTTAYEILHKAKALSKAKMLLKQSLEPQKGPGRRRKHRLPDANQLLSSPNFKLFLYSCKLCNFKCNAIRDLTAHRLSAHNSNASKIPKHGLRCMTCSFSATSHEQMLEHFKVHHMSPTIPTTKTKDSLEAVIEIGVEIGVKANTNISGTLKH